MSEPSKASLKTIAKQLVAWALVIGFFCYLWTIRDKLLAALSQLDRPTLLLISVTLLVQWTLRALRDRLLYGSLDYHTTSHSIFWINSTRICLNYLPFKAGTLSAASLLKSKFGILYRDFVIVFVHQYLLNVLAASITCLIALQYTDRHIGTVGLQIILAGMAAVSLGAMTWNGFLKYLPKFLSDQLQTGSDKICIFKHHPRLAGMAFLLSLGINIANASRLLILFRTFGDDMEIFGTLIVAGAVQLSTVLTVTPAGIGVTEGVAGLSALLARTTAEMGVLVATVDRAALLSFATVISVSGLILGRLAGVRQTRQN